MIKLDYGVAYPYPASAVFGVLTDVPEYPVWQPGVLAARVSGGGPARPGAGFSQVRKVLGQNTYFYGTIESCEQDRMLELRADTRARISLRHVFRLRPAAVSGCCWLDCHLALDGVPSLAESLAEEMLTYQLIEACNSLRAHLGFQATMAEAVPVLTR